MLLKDLIMIHLIFLHVQSCPVLGGLLNMQKTFLRSELHKQWRPPYRNCKLPRGEARTK